MTVQNIRRLAAFLLIGVPAVLADQGAMARSISTTFTNQNGKTFTLSKTTTFNSSNRTTSSTETLTGPQGRTATKSISSMPDGRGGFTVTRSITGFNGQTHTNTHTVGR